MADQDISTTVWPISKKYGKLQANDIKTGQGENQQLSEVKDKATLFPL